MAIAMAIDYGMPLCMDKNQNCILYIAIYMYILLYAAIASYLTTAHHWLSLLDHLFNSL